MNTYKVQCSYTKDGKRIQERNFYQAHTAQRAADMCRAGHLQVLERPYVFQIDYVWLMKFGIPIPVNRRKWY